MEEWKEQLKNFVNTVPKLEQYINLTDDERQAIATSPGRWGTTPYFASLMDPDDPNCPIRRQVVPTMAEYENNEGAEDYLLDKENRADPSQPDCIGRQYTDRIAFTIAKSCPIYCRYCFRKEVTFNDGSLKLRFDVAEGIEWIRNHPEIRDVLITGGDPLMLSDKAIARVINELREIPHLEMIRIGSRMPIVNPFRISEGLKEILSGYHRVPVWMLVHCNHANEITEHTAKAVYDLLTCGVSVGNQAVLLKGINDNEADFRALHTKLLSIRVRPYYVFYCEPVHGTAHFRTPLYRGAELIKNALRGHVTGLAQPISVIATKIGKIPLMPNYNAVEEREDAITFVNHKGDTVDLPNVKYEEEAVPEPSTPEPATV